VDYLKFATDNARREFLTGEPSSPSRRYCGPCDTWHSSKHLECPDCGAATDKAKTINRSAERCPCGCGAVQHHQEYDTNNR
jgi:hypothetical protein